MGLRCRRKGGFTDANIQSCLPSRGVSASKLGPVVRCKVCEGKLCSCEVCKGDHERTGKELLGRLQVRGLRQPGCKKEYTGC